MNNVVRLPESGRTSLRVLVVAESFLPQINGVTNSVRRVLEHLAAEGHTAKIIAPTLPETGSYEGFPVVRARGLDLHQFKIDFRIGVESQRRLRAEMLAFAPDVVHVASPLSLGFAALRAARSLGIPAVAVYQTDLVGFASRYPLPGGSAAAARVTTMIHREADFNLAPSNASISQLRELGIGNVGRWARGVDLELFHPSKASQSLRQQLAPNGEKLVGYVGRLAPEKELDLLQHVTKIPNTRIVLVGEGPEESRLRRLLPDAAFLGLLHGEELASAYASLDVFVHMGRHETYCQSAQEALASGVPVVAPRSGGPIDVVSRGAGFLYEPGNVDELTGYVRNLVEQPLLHHATALTARRSVLGRSWKNVNDGLVEVYRTVIADKAGSENLAERVS